MSLAAADGTKGMRELDLLSFPSSSGISRFPRARTRAVLLR